MSHDSHARIRPITIFGVATALTFFSASQAFYYVSTFGEKPAPFAVLLRLNLGYWYSWACLAPGILWLSRRFPLDKQSWHYSLPAHLAGVFVATTLHIIWRWRRAWPPTGPSARARARGASKRSACTS